MDSGTNSVQTVEVVYALPSEQHSVQVTIAPGMSAAEAVARSGIVERFPEIEQRPLVLGLFGRRISLSQPVSAGDRVEICRPLVADPREMRHQLWKQGRVIGNKAVDE